MESLDQLGIKFQTDKASQFTRTYAKPHDYLRILEPLFEPMRDKPIKVLEIGVGSGESIQVWLEYFKNAQVCGVDINHDTNPWNTPMSAIHDRYKFCQGDQSSETFWACFIATYGSDWGIIIDDGSHISSDIITTFKCLWPHIASGGLYEVEDLGVAHEAASWLMELLNPVLAPGMSDVESVTLAKELIVLRKK